MASDRQIAANRKNGAKGGPKTAAGKQISRLNSIKHGLAAKAIVVMPCEDEAEYHELRQGFIDSFQPANVAETQLVVRLVNAHWKALRKDRIETDLLKMATLDQFRMMESMPKCPEYLNPYTGMAVAFMGFQDQFKTYLRYMAAIDRDFHKSLEALMAMQRHRFKYLAAKPPIPPKPEAAQPQPAAQQTQAAQQQTAAPAQHAQVSENGIRSVLQVAVPPISGHPKNDESGTYEPHEHAA